MSGLKALVKTAKAARKAEPFYSALDEAAPLIKRNSGTGQAFINDLKKVGVKPAELRERGLDKIATMPKITKEEFLAKIDENPAPQVEEKVLLEPTQRDIEARAHEMAYEDAMDELRAEGVNRHDAADEAAEMAEDRMSDYMEQATEELSMANDAPAHGDYTLKGGENYREILLKVPSFKGQNKLVELQAQLRRVDPELNSYRHKELTQQIEALKAEKAAMPEQFKGLNAHFGGEPGILASIRVSDRIMPTYTKAQAEEIGQRIAAGMNVADHKYLANGAMQQAVNKGLVTPKEAAQYADFRGFKGVDTTGARQKVLHVEEIQSDWHQQGKDQGYRTGREEQDYVDYLKELETKAKNEAKADFISEGVGEERAEVLAGKMAKRLAEDPRHLTDYFGASAEAKRMELHQARMDARKAIPDAPFKENWHELALKRMLNYAAEKGYDRVALTPGVEQANRYNLAKQINTVNYIPEEQRLIAKNHEGRVVLDKTYTKPEDLPEYIGKELTQKLLSTEPTPQPYKSAEWHTEAKPTSMHVLTGQDIEIGGEGMRRFYDEKLPSYLNKYGQKYGVQVSPFDIETKPSEGFQVRDTTNAESRPTRFMSATDAANWRSANNYPDTYVIEPQPAQTKQVHGFDITPEMRQEITGKGLPLYQQIGIPTGGAAAGMGALEQEDQGFKKGGQIKKRGRVNVSQNPDTMLLDLLSRS